MDTILSNLSNKGKNIIIIGDHNIDFFIKRSVNTQLQMMLNSYGLQVINVPTRIGHESQTAMDQIILTRAHGNAAL
jgi:hypothetical protein